MECSAGSGCEGAAKEEMCYDVVIVGFGPAALAQAIALYEQKSVPKNILILEKSLGFSWRGNDLPAGRSRMRTNLMQDLVTARDPRSHFTFVNYLWATDNLVAFTNLGAINPPRELFHMYLDWCAKQFDQLGWTQYGREVVGIEARASSSNAVNRFRVRMRDVVNQSTDYVLAKKVIVAPGMVKNIPEPLNALGLEGKVFHSSDLAKVEPQLSQNNGEILEVAIVGANDEAIEVLERCMELDRQVKVTLLAEGTSVQQADKNPFAGNAILASNTSAFETLSRNHGNGRSEPSLQPEALLSLYNKHYAQSVRPMKETQSRFDIVEYSKITNAEKDASNRVTLKGQNTIDHTVSALGPFDVVFAASGYTRGLHEGIMEPLKEYFDDLKGNMSVNADYRVNLDRRYIAQDAGIWMLDGFHGGADDAFPFMALRAERVLRSIMAKDEAVIKAKENHQQEEQPQRALL